MEGSIHKLLACLYIILAFTFCILTVPEICLTPPGGGCVSDCTDNNECSTNGTCCMYDACAICRYPGEEKGKTTSDI